MRNRMPAVLNKHSLLRMRDSRQSGTRSLDFCPVLRDYNNMFNPNTTFNPAFPYAVVCDSAPHENSVFKTLDECWGLCLDLSEEYGYSEVWHGKCLMGSYKNGQ